MKPRKSSARRGSKLLGALALTGVVALLLGACTSGAGTDTPTTAQPTHYTPAPAALQDRVDCLAPSERRSGSGATSPESKLMGSVPEGFVPVEVVRCLPDYVQPPGPSSKAGPVIAKEQLTGDYTALLAALAQPSDRQDGVACRADAEILPGLWLVNAADKAVHVVWPVDACGKARGKPDTAKALDMLTVGGRTVLTAPAP